MTETVNPIQAKERASRGQNKHGLKNKGKKHDQKDQDQRFTIIARLR